ncbi:MAG TPA: polysaccharide biosynthesis protein [Trebonia sp.]|jgi:nucleoside-diphosphate-sugar epimerase|nr:polysaccharide biosynthesis protein [Trebonia sp.]
MSESLLEAGTAREIIEKMRRVAAPGQHCLDAGALRLLAGLTAELVAATRAQAGAEHERFLGIRPRALTLPDDELGRALAASTVLVTGGTGCIGSALLAELTRRGAGRVVSVSRGVTQAWPRVAATEYRAADIRDAATLGAIVAEVRPDVIFHVAAQRDPGLAEAEVHRTITTNVFGTRNVLAAARAAGTPQVVYASTGKALRPYSPETYTASKRAAEWLVASGGGLLTSASRFTHVVDNSIVYQRLLAWAAPATGEERPDAVIRLHDPDISFYVQSARESAQLLLAAYLGARPGEFRVHAISDLGLPVTLLDLALGVLASTGAATPLYFSGYDAGYERVPFPGLYDPMTAGDVSPLLNAYEAADMTGSPSAMVDAGRLRFAAGERLPAQVAALEAECGRTRDARPLTGRLADLSWSLLDSALAAAPRRALERSAAQARRYRDTMIPNHRRMLAAIERLITAC